MTMILDRPTPQGPGSDSDDLRSILAYGTLRPGQRNYESIISRLQHTVTRVTLSGWSLWGSPTMFPYAIPASGALVDPEPVIVGDVLTFSPADWPEALRRCDRLESYPFHYDRVEVVAWATLNSVRAWIYTPIDTAYVTTMYGRITCGDWLQVAR